MIKSILKILLFSVPMLVFSEQIFAFKCGNKIVRTGDQKHKILVRCGEPDFEEIRELRYPENCFDRYGYDHGYGRYRCRYQTFEVWTYNFGPHKLIRELYFRKGILRKIKALGYGY